MVEEEEKAGGGLPYEESLGKLGEVSIFLRLAIY